MSDQLVSTMGKLKKCADIPHSFSLSDGTFWICRIDCFDSAIEEAYRQKKNSLEEVWHVKRLLQTGIGCR